MPLPGHTLCAGCKCAVVDCERPSYRGKFCTTCARLMAVLPEEMAMVEALAPVLRKLLPADVESFESHFDSCQHNLFALMVLAWIKEPWALDFLAPRLCDVASGSQAYKVLSEAARDVVVLAGLTAVKTDLHQQGVAKTTGFLTALKRLGVIGLADGGSSSRPGRGLLPAGANRDLSRSERQTAARHLPKQAAGAFNVAGSKKLYRLTGNSDRVAKAVQVCQDFQEKHPFPESEAEHLPLTKAMVSALATLSRVGRSYVAPHIQRNIWIGHINGMTFRDSRRLTWRV